MGWIVWVCSSFCVVYALADGRQIGTAGGGFSFPEKHASWHPGNGRRLLFVVHIFEL